MKLLVLLAVLGAVSAQYRVYSGVTPYHPGYTPYHSNYAGHPATYAAQPVPYGAHPATYAAHPATYAAHPATYAAHPFAYAAQPYVHGLPFSFKPAEEKKAVEEAKPAVESRAKRSADEDQQAEDATFVSTYAAHTYPLTYTAGYPYTAYNGGVGYHVPTVYNSAPVDSSSGLQTPASTAPLASAPAVYSYAHSPLAYHGCGFGVHGCNVYHGYAAPVVHSLKKRDTAAAEEDQQADEATYVSTYAAHPRAYSGVSPYAAFNGAYHVPTVYNAAPGVPYSGFPYNHHNTYRTFY